MRLEEITRQKPISRNPEKLPTSKPSQQYLYHGSQLYGVALVLKSNALDQGGHWGKPGEPNGVRCSRSLEVAEGFGFDREFPGCVFVLSWPRIAQRWKTIPYTDQQASGKPWENDEQEEVVLTRSIQPLSEYLESLVMRKKEHDELMAGEYLKDEWTEAYASYDGRPLYVHRRAIRALMAYPKFRVI